MITAILKIEASVAKGNEKFSSRLKKLYRFFYYKNSMNIIQT